MRVEEDPMTGVIEALVPLAAGALAWYWASRRQRGSGAWAAGMGTASLVFLIVKVAAAVVTGQAMFGAAGPQPDEHIYVVSADGTGKAQLSRSPGQYSYPDWSPDGKSIVFAAFGLEGGIYVMDADGTEARRLTPEAWTAQTSPTWSPDGGKIAFRRLDPHAPDSLWVMSRDGGGLTQLSQDSGVSEPAWSPDGSKLCYTVYGGAENQVCVVTADGAGKVAITAPSGRGSSPTWAPDSQRLAFYSWGGQASLYTAKADGTGVAPLGTGAYANEPAWSPNGDKIAFVGSSGVFVMNADGTGETALTPAGRYDHVGGLAWSPDGRKLVFWAYSTGAPYPDLCVVDGDGTGLQCVATILVAEPAGRKVNLTALSSWQNLVMLLHPANRGTMPLSDVLTTQSWTSPSGFSWSPDSGKLVFVSAIERGRGRGLLEAIVGLLAAAFFAGCAPAAVVLALRTWWREGRAPGTVTGLVTGSIPTVIYVLLLVWIIGEALRG